jgi:hypothetical protein
LEATDNPGGPGVKQIQFSLAGPQDLNLQTVAGNTASVTVSAEGYTFLGYFATDNAGNQEISRYQIVRIDLTPPVVAVTGVSNGAFYDFKGAPTPGCSTTDALSGVLTPASLAVTGGNDRGYGDFTATCSGAMDEAGNRADPASVSYTINGPTFLHGIVHEERDWRDAKDLQITIRNSGPGTAYGAEITNLSLGGTTQGDGGCTPSLVSALPIALGDIGPSGSVKVSVNIEFSGCKPDARFRVEGQVSANGGTTVGPIRMSDDD